MLDQKIHSATKIIKDAWELADKDGHRFFLFSGGKDSIVACHLANKIVGMKDGFSESCLLPKETEDDVIALAEEFNYNITFNNRLNPSVFANHWDDQICNPKWKPSTLDSIRHWKSIPAYAKSVNASLMLFGRRREENTIPKPFYYKRGLRALQVHPIWNWTRAEVWEYIKLNNLPYPDCYKDGSKHLFTWVSLAYQEYKKTKSRTSTYEVIWRYAPEYLIARSKTEEFANDFVKTKQA
jgi:3'-phosphoadenosine 5'-phosphosulfate sulfotransferase (PAPS reductase)/FAD synthetase